MAQEQQQVSGCSSAVMKEAPWIGRGWNIEWLFLDLRSLWQFFQFWYCPYTTMMTPRLKIFPKAAQYHQLTPVALDKHVLSHLSLGHCNKRINCDGIAKYVKLPVWRLTSLRLTAKFQMLVINLVQCLTTLTSNQLNFLPRSFLIFFGSRKKLGPKSIGISYRPRISQSVLVGLKLKNSSFRCKTLSNNMRSHTR